MYQWMILCVMASSSALAISSQFYPVSAPPNTMLEVCQSSQACDYFNPDDSSITVNDRERSLSICTQGACWEYTHFSARFFAPKRDQLRIVPGSGDASKPAIEEVLDPLEDPFLYNTQKGRGASSFVRTMGRFGNRAAEEAEAILAKIAGGIDEAWAGVKVNGVEVEGRYNGQSNEWTVSVKGPGWGCLCKPDSDASSQP